MFARVTSFEIDPMIMSQQAALERFRDLVMPELRKQAGFEGIYVMQTPEGKGILISLWDSESDAQKGIETGYYDEQLAKFVMFMKQPPGRDHYEVIYSEGAFAASTGSRTQ